MPPDPPPTNDPTMPVPTETVDMLNQTSNAISNQKQKLDDLHGSYNNFDTALDIVNSSMGQVQSAFDNFSKSAGNSGFVPLTAQVQQFAGNFALPISMMNKFADSLNLKGVVTDFAGQQGKNLLTAADNAAKLEGGILHVAGATGQMNAIIQASGDHFQNLNASLQDYAIKMSDIAENTGSASLDDVVQKWGELSTVVPGGSDVLTKAGGKASTSMTTLEAAMKLAAGTGRSYSDVVKDLGTAWEDYGLKGQEALEFTAKISDLSQRFGVNLQYTEDFMKKNADAFSLVSKTAADADQSLNRMFDAFNTGAHLSAKQSITIIGDMTASLSKMTTGQKAFLSAQTGGPGGLRGAYQIDNMLREGKEDEVLKKVEDNLRKQFGGKIYTQKEAGENDFAAAQFTKQTALLKSSAFGNLAGGDDNKAARILEAFNAGTSPKSALNAPKGDEILKSAVEKGTDIEKQTNTIMSQSLREQQRTNILLGINSFDKIQKYFGNTTRADGELSKIGQFLDKVQSDSQIKTQNEFSPANKNIHIDGNAERIASANRTLEKLSLMVPDSLKNAFAPIKEKLSDTLNGTKRQEGMADAKALQAQVDAEQKKILNDIRSHGGKSTDDQRARLTEIQQSDSFLSQLNSQFSQNKPAKDLGLGNVTAASNVPVPRGTRDRGDNPRTTNQRSPAQEVLIKVQGVFCENCHKPINHTSEHVSTSTSNANNVGK